MLIINNNKVCPVCGAYLDGRGICANGHNVEHPVSLESLKEVRFEIGNPNHINIVRQYEMSKGYDRDTDTQLEVLKKYNVYYKLTSIDEIFDIIIVEAYDEYGAEEKAIEELEDGRVEIEIQGVSIWIE